MYNYPYYQTDDRVWVQGEVAAKAYPVIPGNTVTSTQAIEVQNANIIIERTA